MWKDHSAVAWILLFKQVWRLVIFIEREPAFPFMKFTTRWFAVLFVEFVLLFAKSRHSIIHFLLLSKHHKITNNHFIHSSLSILIWVFFTLLHNYRSPISNCPSRPQPTLRPLLHFIYSVWRFAIFLIHFWLLAVWVLLHFFQRLPDSFFLPTLGIFLILFVFVWPFFLILGCWITLSFRLFFLISLVSFLNLICIKNIFVSVCYFLLQFLCQIFNFSFRAFFELGH